MEEIDKVGSICVFCCNTIINTETETPHSQVFCNEEKSTNPLSRFLMLLERHLGIQKCLTKSLKNLETDSIGNGKRQFDTCPLCKEILTSFCDIYHQQQILKLQIQWKLQTLVGIMKYGGRVPSRIKKIKKLFKEEDFGKCTEFMDIRKTLIQTGSQKISGSLPKVRLENSINEKENKMKNQLENNQEENTGWLQCWLMSFAAVVSLLSPFYNPEEIKCTHHEVFHATTTSHAIFMDNVNDLSNVTDENACSSVIKCQALCNSHSSADDRCESDNEMDSIVSHEDDLMNTDQKMTLEVPVSANELPQFKNTECFEQEQNCETDPDSFHALEIKHHFPFASKESSKNMASPNVHTFPVNSQIENAFNCAHCPKTFKYNRSLRKHIKTKHPGKLDQQYSKTVTGMFCKICGIRFASFQSYFLHTKSTNHRRKMKGQRGKRKNHTIGGKENSTLVNSLHPTTDLNSLAAKNVDDCKTESSVIKPRYNLRTRRNNIPVKTVNDSSENSEQNSISEDELSSDDYSSTSSSSVSSCSSVSDSDDTTTPLESIKTEKGIDRDQQQGDIYSCCLDGCSWTTNIQRKYKNHQKLHESRKCKCQFCDLVEENVAKISMHEISAHSKQGPETGQSSVHHCPRPRCPYQSRNRLKYINHFARVHLDIDLEGRKRCSICHVRIRSKKHFETHNTAGMDPSKVFKCSEKDCSVEFVSRRIFRRHRRDYHKISPCKTPSSSNDKTTCNFCDKTFRNKAKLKAHKYAVHSKMFYSDGDIIYYSENTFICPVEKCQYSFTEKETLDKHLKLHGSFKCQFCEVVKHFAPDLPLHELEHFSENNSKAISFKCSRCSFSTQKSVSKYTTHFLETHLNITDKFYECSVCKKLLKGCNTKNLHFYSHHNTEGVDAKEIKRCSKCPAYFILRKQLEEHQQHHCINRDSSSGSNGNSISSTKFCTLPGCLETFEMLEELEAHKKLHGQFKCLSCDFEANYAADLALHEMDHAVRTLENRKKFNCFRCTYSHTFRHSYKQHFIEKHLNLDPMVFICKICKAKNISRAGIQNHFREHHKVNDVDPSAIEKCDSCPAYFLQKVQLLYHKRKEHERQDKFECLDCDRTYKTRNLLNRHQVKMHNLGNSKNKNAFPCDFPGCTKRFDKKLDLMWHRQFGHNVSTKSDEQKKKELEPITCEKCGTEFKGQSGLTVHMTKFHRKNRLTEFKCDKCSKVFKNKAKLQGHQEFQKKPEEWSFMCAVCSKMCPTKYTLKAHMNTHSKAKPFVCQICGEKYAHRHNLRNHVNTKHSNEGVEDIPRKVNRKYFVSRKGKKLGKQFCFTRDGEGASNDVNSNSGSDTS